MLKYSLKWFIASIHYRKHLFSNRHLRNQINFIIKTNKITKFASMQKADHHSGIYWCFKAKINLTFSNLAKIVHINEKLIIIFFAVSFAASAVSSFCHRRVS